MKLHTKLLGRRVRTLPGFPDRGNRVPALGVSEGGEIINVYTSNEDGTTVTKFDVLFDSGKATDFWTTHFGSILELIEEAD